MTLAVTFTDPPPPSRSARWAAVVGAIATLAGLVAYQMWRVLPFERLALSLVLAILALTGAWVLRRALTWSWASALGAVWMLALAVYVGPIPLLAVALLGLCALALGRPLLPRDVPAHGAIAGCVGVLLLAGLAGWAVALPLHQPWVWLALCVGIVALRRRDLSEALREGARGWRDAVDAAPRVATAAVLLLGLASTACWLPSLQMDDLTYHLGLPSQWRLQARYRPDVDAQIWSYAPWIGDTLHAIASVLARREAHGAVNALWLTLAAGAIWSLTAGLCANARERWAAIALFASFPPLVWMAAGQQTELAATAITLALLATMLAKPRGCLWAGTVLFAGLCALKLAHAAAALPLLVYAAWRHRATWRWPRIGAAMLLFAALAGSSYAHAWFATGNPVLPLLNDVFRSSAMPAVAFDDPRWHAGFSPDLLWRMTFDSDRYVEGWDGGLGFGLIALAGLWILALLRIGFRGMYWAVSLAILLPLVPLQYARYAWPSIVVLIACLPASLETQLGARGFRGLIVGLCALNLAFQANASWLHHSAALKRSIRSPFDDRAVFAAYVPERLLLRRVLDESDGLVLATDPARGFVAELGGRGRTISPHAPRWQAAAKDAEADPSGQRWAALWHAENIRWLLVTETQASPALRAGLVVAHARAVAREGDIGLWIVKPPSSASTRGAP